MSNAEKIASIRDVMPVTQEKVYLNVGAVGPLSTIVTESLKQSNDLDLREGRTALSSRKWLKQAKKDLRRAFAELVGAEQAEMALTLHTTNGMNIVAHGLDWQPGDEVITTNLEHPGGLLPLYVLRQRRGVVLKVIELGPEDSPEEIVARFEAAIGPRTRLLAFSHVAWNLGVRLPLAEIVALGHRRQVLSLVDGAQSAGAIPLDLPGSGVDFYALPGQKWLCGPAGIGALYVRRERLSLLWPTFVGYATIAGTGMYDMSGHFMPGDDASRYELGTIYGPGIKAMVDNLTWLTETVGWEWIYGRTLHLAEYARAALGQLSGASLITPPGPQAGLVTFSLPGYDPARVTTRLAHENIFLRFIEQPYALRISTGFYNTEADIDRLVAGLEDILAGDPESLPAYEAS